MRPPVTADYRSRSSQIKADLFLVALGIGIAMIAFTSSIVRTGRNGTAAQIVAQTAWTFGVATAALGTIKTGIGVILWGTVRRLWIRIQSIKETFP